MGSWRDGCSGKPRRVGVHPCAVAKPSVLRGRALVRNCCVRDCAAFVIGLQMTYRYPSTERCRVSAHFGIEYVVTLAPDVGILFWCPARAIPQSRRRSLLFLCLIPLWRLPARLPPSSSPRFAVTPSPQGGVVSSGERIRFAGRPFHHRRSPKWGRFANKEKFSRRLTAHPCSVSPDFDADALSVAPPSLMFVATALGIGIGPRRS